jgi:phosphoglycerate kinase
MYGVAKAIHAKGGPAVAGFLVEKEIKYLRGVFLAPRRPCIAVLGGAKVSDKIKLIANLLSKVDCLLIGGAMAYTLLKAKGVTVGRSRVDNDRAEEVKLMLAQAGNKIVLPCDHVATDWFDAKKEAAGVPVSITGTRIPDNLMGMDLGSKTISAYRDIIGGAATILWNGPVGVFELTVYAHGTRETAKAIAEATERGAISVIGGGDTASAVENTGYASNMSHVSTGGGACLEFLQGETLPGIEVLDTK